MSLEQHALIASDVHARVFHSAGQDWRDYICFLDDEVREMVRLQKLCLVVTLVMLTIKSGGESFLHQFG